MLLRRVWAYMHVGLVPCLHPYMALNTYVTNPLFTILHEEKLDSPNSPVLGTKVGRGARKWLSKGKPTPTSVRSLIRAGSFPCSPCVTLPRLSGQAAPYMHLLDDWDQWSHTQNASHLNTCCWRVILYVKKLPQSHHHQIPATRNGGEAGRVKRGIQRHLRTPASSGFFGQWTRHPHSGLVCSPGTET